MYLSLLYATSRCILCRLPQVVQYDCPQLYILASVDPNRHFMSYLSQRAAGMVICIDIVVYSTSNNTGHDSYTDKSTFSTIYYYIHSSISLHDQIILWGKKWKIDFILQVRKIHIWTKTKLDFQSATSHLTMPADWFPSFRKKIYCSWMV